jgi:hypothetical protein
MCGLFSGHSPNIFESEKGGDWEQDCAGIATYHLLLKFEFIALLVISLFKTDLK